jgi:hypothetical protein
MPALKLDLTIPLGDTGHVALTIDIADIDALTPAQRTAVADTGTDFCAFAAATLAPHPAVMPDGARVPTAFVHDPGADLLRGVTGSRIRDKL